MGMKAASIPRLAAGAAAGSADWTAIALRGKNRRGPGRNTATPSGSEVPHGIAAEGPIPACVIGEIDDRSMIAGTDRTQLFVVDPPGGVP